MFYSLYAWYVMLWELVRFLLYQMGLVSRPRILDRYDAFAWAFRQLTRINSHMRIVGGRHCPQTWPAVFACNHVRLDDPFYVCVAVNIMTSGCSFPRFVMRDDYFNSLIWRLLPINLNVLSTAGGASLISRDRPQLGQLKTVVRVIEQKNSVVVFPGRSRSRTGLLFDYEAADQEPGSPAFLAALGHRQCGCDVPVVPVARSWHPVTRVSAIGFGEPLHVPPDAKREQLCAIDHELFRRIGAAMEVNAGHIFCGIIYLAALHQAREQLDYDALLGGLRTARDMLRERRLHPELLSDSAGELNRLVRYFHKRRYLRREGSRITLRPERILNSPSPDMHYRTHNEVKFFLNQCLHVKGYPEAVEVGSRRLL